MSMVNNAWARVLGDGERYVLAPKYLTQDLHEPTAEEYRAAGYAENAILPPSPPEGKVVKSVRYECVSGQILAVYEYADAPVRIRTFSKLRLWNALNQRGLWSAFKSWLAESGLEDPWNMAQNLSTDYAGWEQIASAAQSALNVDNATMEAILKEAEDVSQ